MAQHEVITRGGDAFLLKLRESALSSGSMSEEQFFLLIGISSIHSDRVILAMKDYLVSGRSRKDVCEKYQMNNGYFSTTGVDDENNAWAPYQVECPRCQTCSLLY